MPFPTGVGRYTVTGAGRYHRHLGPGAYTQPPSTPPAPASVITVDGPGSGTVLWEPPSFTILPVLAYRVQHAPVSGGVAGDVAGVSPDLGPEDRKHIVSVPAGQWAARVEARNAEGWGDPSDWTLFKAEAGETAQARPVAPTNLSVFFDAGAWRFTFTPPPAANPPVSSYAYQLDGGTPVPLLATATGGTFPTPADGSHVLSLTAINDVGTSPAVSDTFSVATSVAVQPPTSVSAAPTFDGAVVTLGASPSSDVARYELVVDGTRNASILASANPLRYAFTGLLSGQHSGTVVAVAADGRRSGTVTFGFFVAVSSGAVVEYRVTSTDNRAGYLEAARNAGVQGKKLRIVGDGLGPWSGTGLSPHSLREQSFDPGVGFRQTANAKGTLNRAGSLGPAIPVSRMSQFDNTITVPDASGVEVGAWYYVMASNQTSHKETFPGFARQVTGKSGTTVELDLDLHRSGSGYMRMHKITWAPSLVTERGIFEHANQFSCDFPLVGDCLVRDSVYTDLVVRRNGSPGYWAVANMGTRATIYASGLVDDENGSRYGYGPRYGYGVSEQGTRDFEYWLKCRKESRFGPLVVRHLFTTAQMQWVGGFGGNLEALLMKKGGESEHGKVHIDAEDATSTSYNPHEPGWKIGFGGRSVRPGRWKAAGSGNPQEGGGHVYIRDRGAYVLPEGFYGEAAAESYAQVEVAAKASANSPATGWSMAEAPTLDNMVIVGSRSNTTGLTIKQKAKIGGVKPLVIDGVPALAEGILIPSSQHGAGSQLVGRVELTGSMTTGLSGASRISGKENIFYGPGVKTQERD